MAALQVMATGTVARTQTQIVSLFNSLSLRSIDEASLLLGGSFGFLLLDELGKSLLVGLEALSSLLLSGEADLSVLVLAAESALGHQALNSGRLVEGLVLSLDLTANNVLANIVLLGIEAEGLDDVVPCLGTKTVGNLDISQTLDVLLTLFDDSQEESADVRADDATTDGLSFAVAVTTWLEGLASYRIIIKYRDWRGRENIELRLENYTYPCGRGCVFCCLEGYLASWGSPACRYRR